MYDGGVARVWCVFQCCNTNGRLVVRVEYIVSDT